MSRLEEVCVVGATGLVGEELVDQLLARDDVQRVTTLVRRSTQKVHPKLTERVISFEDRSTWANWVRGRVLFSALGTTLKAAGSQAAQRRVDFDYQLWAAQAARSNGTETYVLVSSTGASSRSPLFYTRMKGELEDSVLALQFASTRILRPSFLDGLRKQVRPAERLALSIARALPQWPFLASVRAIASSDVARCAIDAATDPLDGPRIYEAKELFELIGRRGSRS